MKLKDFTICSPNFSFKASTSGDVHGSGTGPFGFSGAAGVAPAGFGGGGGGGGFGAAALGSPGGGFSGCFSCEFSFWSASIFYSEGHRIAAATITCASTRSF